MQGTAESGELGSEAAELSLKTGVCRPDFSPFQLLKIYSYRKTPSRGGSGDKFEEDSITKK
jgi:hypothetical protein